MKRIHADQFRSRVAVAHGGRRQEIQETFRRGAFFTQVMIYVTLTSSLLTLGAVILHTTLRADSGDRRQALQLNSLQRLEHQLRRDRRESPFRLISMSELELQSAAGETVQWLADRSLVTRTVLQGGAVTARDQFVFPAGSSVEMIQGADGLIVIRITDPPPFSRRPEGGHGGDRLQPPSAVQPEPGRPGRTDPQFIEIHLRGAAS